MRILHLVHQYPPHSVGGTEYFTQIVATAQAKFGHDVAVFVPAPSDKPPKPSLSLSVPEVGVRIYRIPVGDRRRTQVFLQSFRQPRLLHSWRTVLDTEQPDLVHIEHLMGIPFSFIDDLCERNIPYVVTLHDYWFVCANAQLLTNTDQTICAGPNAQATNCARCALARIGYKNAVVTAPLVAPIMIHRNSQAAFVLKKAGRIIAPTKFLRDLYLSLVSGEMKIVVLQHGIALPQKAIEKAWSERNQRIQDGRLHIGYVGGISRQKGVHVLVDAVNGLPGAAATHMIYGDPTVFPEYVLELKDSIKHPGIKLGGVLGRDQFWSTLAAFDVVVLPTMWHENSPMVVDEAFALGIPVIVSDIGSMTEKIRDGENGRLFAPGDVNALRNILLELIMAPATLAEWGRNIEPVNCIHDHIRALEEIYAGALNPV